MEIDPWVWLAVAGLLLLLCLIWARSGPSRSSSNAACDNRETILVLMHSYKSNAETVFTMCQMLQAAACPYRLSFALYQDVKKEQDVYDMYQQVAGPIDRSDYIRVLSRPSSQTKGSLQSILEMVDRLHQGERYLLITQPGTIFVDHFDNLLLQHLPSHGALTGCGLRNMTKQTKWMGYLNSALPQFVPRKTLDRTSSFPVITQRPGQMPHVQGQSTHASKQRYDALCLDARMIFLRHRDWMIGSIPCTPPSMDLFLTAMFYHHGIYMYASPLTVAWGPKKIRQGTPNTYDEKACVDWLRSQVELMEFLGLDHRLRPCGRAQMGLLPNHPFKLIKYGSETNFQREKTRFAFDSPT